MEQLPIKYRNSGKLLDDAKFIIETVRAVAYRSVNVALVITPGKVDHDPVWDYPLEAIRETLANAICHRDYGAPYDIQVKVFEDSLRISSPGQLPFDIPMEFLMDPAHPSRPRNKIIAQAFFDMGIIERYGSGKYSWNSTNSKGARRRRRGSARVIARNRFE